MNSNNNMNSNNMNNDELAIVFKRNNDKDKTQFTIKIICKYDELVKDVFDRYCFKTNEKKKDLLFFFNSLQLKENLTVRESGLTNTSIVFVINASGIRGG